LLEELRRDLPDVAYRHDPEVASMQTPADPHAVLSALETQVANKKTGSERADVDPGGDAPVRR
jgi:hypothetical protein